MRKRSNEYWALVGLDQKYIKTSRGVPLLFKTRSEARTEKGNSFTTSVKIVPVQIFAKHHT